MDKPELTIGMAHHNDAEGVYWTIQRIKENVPQPLLSKIELVLVNQSPSDVPESHGQLVKSFMYGHARSGVWGTKYLDYTERVGTSASRSKIFEIASADTVMVVDCHIGLLRGGVEAVLDYFKKPEHHLDIVSGPLLTDSIYKFQDPKHRYDVLGVMYADHFRDRMWGTWGNVYRCTCGDFHFTTFNEHEVVRYETVEMNPQRVKNCPICNKKFPLLAWPGHENLLDSFGYINLGQEGTEPFEIPGQGLGMFACRKDAWPGFNPDVWGFGGEELYIHEKFRMLGGRAMCIPQALWHHRWWKLIKPTYPNTDWYKCRNYILEFQELATLAKNTGYTKRKFDLEEVRKHFVEETKVVPPHEWEIMVKEPLKFVHGPTENHVQPTMVDGRVTNNIKISLDGIFDQVKALPRDLDKHMPMLLEIAQGCQHITEFSKRRESLITWARARPKRLVSHNLEAGDKDARMAVALVQQEGTNCLIDTRQSTECADIEDTDLLWIDTVHHADRLRGELQKFGHRSKHYIIVRGTGSFGVNAEGGGPGLFEAMREFVHENPQWFVMLHATNQYGLTVLSCVEEDKPPQPIIPWPPGWGPGTELKKVLLDLGITDKPGCDCNGKALQMDYWGIEGCEERFDLIVEWMREGAPRWGWSSYITAGWKALISGLAFKLDVSDPFPGMVRLAIDRAKRVKETRR